MGNLPGCVAKTSGELVKVAFVLTVARPTHSIHEHLAAGGAWRHFQSDVILLCVFVVLAVSTQLPQRGLDDALYGVNSIPGWLV